MNRSHALVASILAAGLLSACASTVPTTAIRASDHGVDQPAIRVSIGLPGTGGAPLEAHDGQAVEISLTSGKGRDTQVLGAGEPPVIYGDPATTFNAPQVLQHEFRVDHADVAWRGRLFFGGKPAGMEFAAGLSYLSTDLTVSSATQRAKGSISAVGVSLGIGGVWRLASSTSLQARATYIAPFSDLDEATRIEAYLVQGLGRNLAVRAGYASWRVRVDSGARSAIKLDFAGPSLGLDLGF